MSRKTIRDGIKAAIEGIYSGSVFLTRRIDARDLSEYINVFMSSGSANTESGLHQQIEARLVISIAKKGATDDQLDEVADQIEAMLDDLDYASIGAIGAYFSEFQYADDDDEFEKLHITYDIIFSR